MSIFSLNLKWLRSKLGVSQSQVATSIRKKKSTYQSYEEARAEPKLDDLILIADYFDISIDDLLVNDMTGYKELCPDFVKAWESKHKSK